MQIFFGQPWTSLISASDGKNLHYNFWTNFVNSGHSDKNHMAPHHFSMSEHIRHPPKTFFFFSILFFFFFGLSSQIRQGLKYKEKKKDEEYKTLLTRPWQNFTIFLELAFVMERGQEFFLVLYDDQGNTKNRYLVLLIIKNLLQICIPMQANPK